MSLSDFLAEQLRLKNSTVHEQEFVATEATPATARDKCPDPLKSSSPEGLRAVSLAPFHDEKTLRSWIRGLENRLTKLARGNRFSDQEITVYRQCLKRCSEREYRKIREGPMVEELQVPAVRLVDYQSFTSELPGLLKYYQSALDAMLRVFPLSQYNLDYYDYFRSYHRHQVMKAESTPSGWTEERCRRVNIKNLESGLLEREIRQPPDHLIPLLTGKLSDVVEIAARLKVEIYEGKSNTGAATQHRETA